MAQTALAREILGPDKLLIPERAVSLHADSAVARRNAREYRDRSRAMISRLGFAPTPPTVATCCASGYSVEDVTDNSDRLVDDLIAHGDETAIAARVRAQLDAGADHVLVHPVDTDLTAAVDTLERLAPALREVRG